MNKTIITAIFIALLAVCSVFAAEEPAATQVQTAQSADHVEHTEAEQEEQPGVFGGSLGDALWAVIAFTVLVIVLRMVAWKPLLQNLQARENHIKQQLTDAESAKQKAENLLDDYKKQSTGIIENANRYASQTSKEIVGQARKEAIAITERANSEIASAQNVASQQLWHMAGNMLIAISHEVLGRTVTPEDNKRLIHEAIGKLQEENLKQ